MWGRSLAAAVLAAFLGLPLDATAATPRTGDVIGGEPVIGSLDIADLEPGTKQRLLFAGVEMATGQLWYVPVMTAKETAIRLRQCPL